MTAPLRVQLKPAPLWAAIICLVHLLAVAGAWLGLPAIAALIATAGLVLGGALGAAAALLRGPLAVLALEFKPDGTVAWVDRQGEWRAAVLESWGMIGLVLTALLLSSDAGRRAVVLVPGVAGVDVLRELRVWLRWRMPSRSDARPPD